jgi:hypothetical protein
MASGVDRIAGQNPFLQASTQSSNALNTQGVRHQPVALNTSHNKPQAYQFDSVVFGNGQPKTATDWLQSSLSGPGSHGRIMNQTA